MGVILLLFCCCFFANIFEMFLSFLFLCVFYLQKLSAIPFHYIQLISPYWATHTKSVLDPRDIQCKLDSEENWPFNQKCFHKAVQSDNFINCLNDLNSWDTDFPC